MRPPISSFVVEGQGRQIREAGVGAPLLDEGLGLVDLAAPLLGRPVADRAEAGAEVAVEVGAYLMALEPGAVDVLQGGAHVRVRQITDVGGARRVVRRQVQTLLRLGQQIEPGEEEGHVGAVLLGEVEEAREETVADLAGAVPGEDDELRRRLTRFQGPRPVRLVGLLRCRRWNRTEEARGGGGPGAGAGTPGVGGAPLPEPRPGLAPSCDWEPHATSPMAAAAPAPSPINPRRLISPPSVS